MKSREAVYSNFDPRVGGRTLPGRARLEHAAHATAQLHDLVEVVVVHTVGGKSVFGTEDKRPAAEQILARLGLTWAQAAAMGDDWPDLPVMRSSAFACAPANAQIEVRHSAHFVTQARGGEGAARELCDLLLVATGRYAALLAEYIS